jgi:hypothetical protein
MKTNLWSRILCLAGLAAGLSAAAMPLQRADVAAEPGWLVHVDCDALRPTAIGQYLLSELDKPEAQGKLGAFQAIFSFDPRTQLHGLTLYSTSDAPEDGVLLIHADFDAERLVTLAKGANDYQSTTHNGQTIHSWTDEKKKAKHGVKSRVYAALQGNRIIVFGQRESAVAAALDVLGRKVANLSMTKTFPQLGETGDHAIVRAAARKLNISSSDPNAAILRLAKQLRLQIGEAGGNLTATLSLEAGDEEVAKQLAAVGQGLVALLKLQQEKPEAMRLANALSLKQDGLAVIATLGMPTDEVVAMMKAGAEKKAAKKAQVDAAKDSK